MKANDIIHTGIVESIDGLRIRVKVGGGGACASCGAKGCCSTGAGERLLEVMNAQGLPCHKGQEVRVRCNSSLGMKAVGIAFGIPFVVLLFALWGAMKLTGGNEGVSALLGLGALSVCYVVLYAFRSRLEHTFSFTLESTITTNNHSNSM